MLPEKPLKILAIQFRYLGDAVLLVPALRAIRQHHPNCELHVLVPEEAGPLLCHLPWLNRLWLMPRKRGRAQLKQCWPMLRALRAERFDRSVDFSTNDRSAIMTLLAGARQRLGDSLPGGFLGRRFCYTQRLPALARDRQESARLIHLLTAWGINSPISLEAEIHTDAALNSSAKSILPEQKIICHLAASQPNKEWPLAHWSALHRLAANAGLALTFSTGNRPNEALLMKNFRRLTPDAEIIEPIPNLALYLAVIKRARLFVSGDTGPLHFAAGVGVPTLALFGYSSPIRWAPIGKRHQFLSSSNCSCHSVSICQNTNHCLAAITPEQVFTEIMKLTCPPGTPPPHAII